MSFSTGISRCPKEFRKQSGYLLCILTCIVFGMGQASAKELKCSSERRFGNEGSFTVEARLGLNRQEPHNIALESTTVVNSTRTGYTCSAEFEITDQTNHWDMKDRLTTISSISDEPAEVSRLTIKRMANGYQVDTRHLSTANCGARAQWPLQIFIPVRGSRCVTRYE